VLIVAAPEAQIGGVVMQTTILFFYVSVVVLIVAMIASFLLSRKQAQSIQTVTRAAVRFGRGELDTRVPVGGKNTVEVDDLAVAFNTMAESLSQSERQRQEFVANVSHELKTPMTTIAGFMDGMLDGAIPPEKHRHYMELVSDEVRRLSRLVRSMLEISRLQSQGILEEKKRRFDLCEAIGQVLISFERRVNEKRIHMDVQLPDRSIWVKADPDSITQVIYNLTDNAIKFCDAGGSLSIWLKPEGGKAWVSVQNTGGTVPAEELPLLFDRFHKADKSRSADREGVGLGLYIVKTILNSHGEDISVTSRDGVTTFVFSLPLVR
jgi:signal transduction histidine kinase